MREVAARVMGYRRVLLWLAAVVALVVAGCESETSGWGVDGPGIGLSERWA